jgi:hypothetical protein
MKNKKHEAELYAYLKALNPDQYAKLRRQVFGTFARAKPPAPHRFGYNFKVIDGGKHP